MRKLNPRDLLLTLLAVLFSLPAWAYPLGNDQAVHWYLGRRWLDGELPFVSGISSKPIGIFVIHALSIALFGPSEMALRISETVSVVLTGFLVAWVSAPRGLPVRGSLGLGALLFSGLYYTFYDYWDTGHPELWEAAFVLLAMGLAIHVRRPWLRDAGAGAACMAAFMVKFPAAFPALIVAGYLALCAVRERGPDASPVLRVLSAAGRFVLGGLTVALLCVLPFAVFGQLGPMWEILVEFMLGYVSRAHYAGNVPAWLRIEHGGGLLIACALVSALTAGRLIERKELRGLERLTFLVLALGLAWASVSAQGWYFDYHWMVLGPFLAAILMFGLRQLLPERPLSNWHAGAVVLLLALSVWAGPQWMSGSKQTYGKYVVQLVAYLRDELPHDEFIAPFKGRGALDARKHVERAAQIVKDHRDPGDTLCVRGFSTPLYVLTDMRCTSRHVVQQVVPNGLPHWKKEYADTMRRDPPTFIITFLDRKRDIRDIEAHGYRLVGSSGLFGVYSRKPARPGLAASTGS